MRAVDDLHERAAGVSPTALLGITTRAIALHKSDTVEVLDPR